MRSMSYLCSQLLFLSTDVSKQISDFEYLFLLLLGNIRSDVYSFGVILWEIATEKIPWDNLNSMQVLLSCVHEPSKYIRAKLKMVVKFIELKSIAEIGFIVGQAFAFLCYLLFRGFQLESELLYHKGCTLGVCIVSLVSAYLVFELHLFYVIKDHGDWKLLYHNVFLVQYEDFFMNYGIWITVGAYMNNCSSRNLAGDWSCRIHESTARNSKKRRSTVGFYN